ncbi:xanthine dehydrogenase accessory protein XdhC [Pseudooceanicola sp. CBS1P-1]|uniref:Xanthine dehydrogenase accessory protein XdhC n=1 Tax=Pseudooceanicola albus TaxID=2692189 RepID=A0A6L7G9Z5_9RHOB|nr:MULTISPECIES: xanthine dehydrogenase accessory protein XdhC [Pseudooceanicola]MBT9386918.1 xanthine dehydrogenase accessory protein XdhC [Pseudooceanicola endophyticus]MXN21024.1 xanthine dehydrogenase accessory protein XdhC [Pseudooceanicola albus]
MLERAELARAIARAGRVVRIVVAETRGSAPREAGTAMLVGPDFECGTIGGGTLEHEAIATARALRADRFERKALGPDLGQCCGGAVALLYEIWDAGRLAGTEGEVLARPLPGTPGAMPFAVKRLLARARASGQSPRAGLYQGWMVEPLARPDRQVWIWGAGHVGRALVQVLAPLPGIAITWVDTGPERFPEHVPEGVTILPAADPALLATHAPVTAEHLILTYSHALDLALCDALLRRGFGWCGLIGSASKWARFRKRLGERGHASARIAGITCPIGIPAFGKHPQEIAVGVAAGLLHRKVQQDAKGEQTA